MPAGPTTTAFIPAGYGNAIPVAAERPQTVLVVDDEPDILSTLASYLGERLDAKIEAFEAGPPALERVEAGGVDLLLTDFRMPDMDGLELVRRSHDAIPDLGTMMITAYPDTDLAIRAINEGRIMHFFVKPPDPERLGTIIKEYLSDLQRLQDRRAAFDRALELGRRALRQGNGA